ncbi:UNVERIFIED_CONTAM: hypothetical protein Sindi_2340100 [Sesamum indicum]
MDSPKTLSSLTHTSTPTLSHTSTLTHGTLGDDGEAEAEDSSELGTDNNWVVLATEEYHVPAVRILSPVGSDDVCSSFEIVQFLTLVNRIVDDGDVASLTALETFKKKWELRYGPIWLCHVLAVCLARGLRMARRPPYQQDLDATLSPPALAPASLIPSFSAVQTVKADTIGVVESLSISTLMPVVACSMMDAAVSPVHTLLMTETISAALSMMIVSVAAMCHNLLCISGGFASHDSRCTCAALDADWTFCR